MIKAFPALQLSWKGRKWKCYQMKPFNYHGNVINWVSRYHKNPIFLSAGTVCGLKTAVTILHKRSDELKKTSNDIKSIEIQAKL